MILPYVQIAMIYAARGLSFPLLFSEAINLVPLLFGWQ
jgi:hypothetical protein